MVGFSDRSEVKRRRDAIKPEQRGHADPSPSCRCTAGSWVSPDGRLAPIAAANLANETVLEGGRRAGEALSTTRLGGRRQAT